MGSGHSVPPGEMPSDATQLFIILWELAAFIITASYFIVRPHLETPLRLIPHRLR